MNSLPLDPTCKARSKKFSISKTIKHKNKNNKNKNIKKKKKAFPTTSCFCFLTASSQKSFIFSQHVQHSPPNILGFIWFFFFFFFSLPLRPLIKFSLSLSQSSKRGQASVCPAVTSAVVTTPHTGYYFSLFWDLG